MQLGINELKSEGHLIYSTMASQTKHFVANLIKICQKLSNVSIHKEFQTAEIGSDDILSMFVIRFHIFKIIKLCNISVLNCVNLLKIISQ